MYRELGEKIKKELKTTNRVVVLLGARQVGKTTLLKNCFPNATYINLEVGNNIDIFNTRDLEQIRSVLNCNKEALNTKEILILDEIQRLDDPGLVAKVIFDEMKDVHLIISGSSALEIAHKASESLAGRKVSYFLYPLTIKEKLTQENRLNVVDKEFAAEAKDIMLHGLYPELLNITSKLEKEKYLKELVDGVIMKDIYYLNLVKNTKNLVALLTLLAHQVGQKVNVTELSNRIGIARQTVDEYLSILKKTFIIFTLSPYTKKRRDEIGKMEKVYFYDLGIRNALINDFSPVEYRRDYGNIFENFVITEFVKLNQYQELGKSFYYWRTKWGSEVDLVSVKDADIDAIEIKTRQGKITPAFKDTYPQANEQIVTMENMREFLL